MEKPGGVELRANARGSSGQPEGRGPRNTWGRGTSGFLGKAESKSECQSPAPAQASPGPTHGVLSLSHGSQPELE